MTARGRHLAGAVASLLLTAACASTARETPAPGAASADAGRKLYGQHCLTCHQADGGGVPNMQPAIVGGTWVAGDPRALASFVLTGGFDSASRKDSAQGNVMPPFSQLSDADLAGILSYIRGEFGKGASRVTAAEVAEARASLSK